MSVAVIVIAGVLVATLLFVILTYNRLTSLRFACESSWSQIDVALQLRHDLVPRLAEAVSGYATHERRTLERVAERRSEAIAARERGPRGRGAAEAALAGGITDAILLAEDYPELLATENFARLQEDLGEVEEKLSITRRVYNDTVETYNTAIAVFPPVVVARAFRFQPREFFDAPVEAEAVPAVSVGRGA